MKQIVLPLSCPDCSGVLSVDQEGPRGRRLYACQVGHWYSTTSLLHSKETQLERTLWSAAVLLKQMGDAYELLLKDMSREDSERKQVQRRLHHNGTSTKFVPGSSREVRCKGDPP